MRRLIATVLATAGALLLGAAPTSAAPTPAAPVQAPFAQAAPAPAVSGAHPASAFPVTIDATNGKVTFTSAPTRIMSLSPSATEMLYADGAGHQVVAVDKYSTVPANAPRTSFTGDETSAEDYVRYHPDLVVLAFDVNGLVHQLELLHIPVLLMPPAATLPAAYQQFVQLGEATGHRAQAAAEVASLKRQLAAGARSAGSRSAGASYFVELDPTLYTATSKTFIGAVFGMLRMVDVADAAPRAAGGYPQISAEYLLHANPDYVFLADGQSPASFAHRPGFSVLRAVQLHHVFVLPESVASQWGTLIVQFLRTVANDVRTSASASKAA